MPDEQAIHISDWPEMSALAKEYKIDILELAEAIEQKGVKTRGRGYDDYCQYSDTRTDRGDGFIEIPADKWSAFLFEVISDGKCFLYGFQYLPFAGIADAQEIKSGYIDIQVNRADFESKIKIKTLPTGKRVHKHLAYLGQAYKEAKKSKRQDRVGPKEFLKYLEKNYKGFGDFEIESVEHSPGDKGKTRINLSIEGHPKSISYDHFCNIISAFNNPIKT